MKRRDVLKGLASGAALLAVPAGAWAAGASERAYAASRFGLMLDGVFVGFVQSAEGGSVVGQVVAEPTPVGPPRKHLASVDFEPILLQIGAGMGRPLYDWIASVLDGNPVRKSGEIIAVDANYATVSRVEFSNAAIASIGLPAMDASSKEPAYIMLELSPEFTRRRMGDGATLPAGIATKSGRWLRSNFKLDISGLQGATSRVATIEALTITRKSAASEIGAGRDYVEEPDSIDIANLVFTVPESGAEPLSSWHEDFVVRGNNGQDEERTGTLEYLSPDLKTPLLTIRFSGLGIFSLSPEKSVSGQDTLRRMRAALYCETLTLDFGK
jgi:hypothetical protein